MTTAIHDLVPLALRRAWAADGSYPDLDLYSLFRAHRIADPHRIAVVDARGAVSYARLDHKARCLAAALRAAGIRAGDVVGVQLPNDHEAVAADLALAALGAIALPFPVGRGSREALSLLGRSGARAVIAVGEYRDTEPAREIARLAPGLPALRVVVAAGGASAAGGTAADGCLSLEDLLRTDASGFTPERPAPDSAARILVSSGTEAEPKMVAYSHNALAGGRGNFLAALLPSGTRPRCLFLVPLASAFGSSGTAVTLARHGGTLDLLERFTPAEAVEAIRRHRPTHVLGVPTMVRMMLDLVDEPLPGLTALVLGGSPLDEATRARAERTFGCTVVNLYGSADGVNCHSGLDPKPDRAAGPGTAIGRPDATVAEIRITTPNGELDTTPGEIGEIVARGPMTPLCYVGAPELNRRYRTTDGWVRTGDLGTFDTDGVLRLVGRLKDIVIRGGANISPAEVEGELSAHPDVRDVLCTGVPDPLMGERLAACLVPRAGRTPTLEELSAHLDDRGLDRRKHPERLVLLDALPLTPAGKPDRPALRRLAVEAG